MQILPVFCKPVDRESALAADKFVTVWAETHHGVWFIAETTEPVPAGRLEIEMAGTRSWSEIHSELTHLLVLVGEGLLILFMQKKSKPAFQNGFNLGPKEC